jgi:hypothetical protein
VNPRDFRTTAQDAGAAILVLEENLDEVTDETLNAARVAYRYIRYAETYIEELESRVAFQPICGSKWGQHVCTIRGQHSATELHTDGSLRW